VKLLALDTSSLACSVAVELDGRITERHEERPREHTRIFVPMIRDALAEAGLAVAGLDAIVLGNGPGSFIGMRIAASVAQGLAYGAGLDIVPVSSLAAVAAEVLASHDADEVVVAQDAHMNEVYLGIYRRGPGDLPTEVVAERLWPQERIPELSRAGAAARVAAGFGWRRYPGLLEANRNALSDVLSVSHPRARHLLAPGAAAFAATGAVDPRLVEPAYLRQKVAAVPGRAR
jgi:tRNA threonylcarbamoyladenosine biosynthesis protein TsaB